MLLFDPPENIRKPKIFLYFQEDQKRKLGEKKDKKIQIHSSFSSYSPSFCLQFFI